MTRDRSTGAYSEVALGIARFLADRVGEKGFPARSFYGESYSLWLWHLTEINSLNDAGHRLLAFLPTKRASDPWSHHEFNQFALLHYYAASGDPRVGDLLSTPRFTRVPLPNWGLLRILTKLLWNRIFRPRFPVGLLRLQTRLLLGLQQSPYGMISDNRMASDWIPVSLPVPRFLRGSHPRWRSRSLQYHAFSTSLLYDLYLLTGWPFVATVFERALDFLHAMVLPDGDAIYVGRGQQQIFGYGALGLRPGSGSRVARPNRVPGVCREGV